MCYVTAKIITPAGVPLNEEKEEGLLPPELPEVPTYKIGGNSSSSMVESCSGSRVGCKVLRTRRRVPLQDYPEVPALLCLFVSIFENFLPQLP